MRGRRQKFFTVRFSLIHFNKTKQKNASKQTYKKKKEIPISLIYSAKPKIRGQMKVVKMLQSLEESDLEL